MKRNYYEPIELESFTYNEKRYYILPKTGIAVPSVTSVIYAGNNFKETPESYRAKNRGTTIHKMCEDYIKCGIVDLKAMPSDLQMFLSMKEDIDENLAEVNLLEGSLYSNTLLTAGRVDCVGIWNKRKSVIDFKTSKFLKKEDWLENYFIQAAAYAIMYNECYPDKEKVHQLVLCIGVDHEDSQIFTRDLFPEMQNKAMEVFMNRCI